jgi:hypothetical protein
MSKVRIPHEKSTIPVHKHSTTTAGRCMSKLNVQPTQSHFDSASVDLHDSNTGAAIKDREWVTLANDRDVLANCDRGSN